MGGGGEKTWAHRVWWKERLMSEGQDKWNRRGIQKWNKEGKRVKNRHHGNSYGV